MKLLLSTILSSLVVAFARLFMPNPRALVYAATKVIAEFDATTDSGNIQNPLRGAASANLEANGVAVVAATDTLEVDCSFNDDVEFIVQGVGGTSAFSFAAGDYPPSPHAGRGAALFSIPSGETWRIILQAGRHVHDDGKIRATCATADAAVWAFRAPAGFLGLGYTNRATIPAAPAHV